MKDKKASLYRMVMKEHICPFGLKSKHLLNHYGYDVEDHLLTSREETNQFKKKHNVETTPQTFINNQRVGGYDALRKFFGKNVKNEKEVSYQPVISVFSMALLMALSVNWLIFQDINLIKLIELFVAFSMCILAILKLRDVESFTNQFLGYDLLAQRWVPYAYIFPFAEAFVGIGMITQILMPVVALVAIFIGGIGSISVIKAVYIEKRELKCACVGGKSNVPLGAVSLTEDLMMVFMGLWMFIK